MNTNLKAIAGMILMATVVAAQGQTTATSTAKKPATRKHVVAKKPSIESQIESLRQDMESQRSQITNLQQQLTQKDAQLQQAQQAASAAQSAAEQAQQAANAQQTQVTETQQNVASLQGAVGDLKTNTQSLVSTIQDGQAQVKKAIESPDSIHYKGVTISPAGSFIEAATVYRSAATGGDINTPFTGIPLNNSTESQMSEFYGSGRQSRLALGITGKAANATLKAYYEMDWLGTGITSNNNQSNSYVMRMRQLWAQAALNNGWTFTGGQMWTLATEDTQGESNGTEILPATIDPQYNAGFVWARQYGFRVTKNINNKIWFGASAENAETLNPGGSSLPTNEVIGTNGVGGGLYNAYANYSFNLAPDIIAKVAFEPGFGHYEIFGISRFFRDRVFPNFAAGSAAGAYNDSMVGGGIGGSARMPFANKKLIVAIKGLYGDGTGRYGSSTIADVTIRPDGQLSPLHNFDALGTVEANPTKRLNLYANYGGDYVARDYVGKVGYGSPLTAMTGCNTEAIPGTTATVAGGTGFLPTAPANCSGNNKDVQELSTGYWYNLYNGPYGRLRQGIQYSYFRRDLWSGAGGTTNPGGGAHGTDNLFETSLRYYLP